MVLFCPQNQSRELGLKRKFRFKLRYLFFFLLAIGLVGFLYAYFAINSFSKDLPKLIKIEDFDPLRVSEVYAKNGKKIGEFFRERRILVKSEEIPQKLKEAFIAAEDASFYEHSGINYFAILRAMVANIRAGKRVQGGSTITQQLTKTLFLSRERTYTRKLKEFLLAQKMESTFKKEEILFLYLNQIYFGQGAYGVKVAAQAYFRKDLDQLEYNEMALLAALPKAPSAFSPFTNPTRAKQRQVYVLNRMAKEGFITEKEAKEHITKELKVYKNVNFTQIAPYYTESVRQLLFDELGESMVLDKGLKIYTNLDYDAQIAAEESVKNGVEDINRRQGFTGAIQTLKKDEWSEFLHKQKKQLISKNQDFLIFNSKGEIEDFEEFIPYRITDEKGKITSILPPYLKIGDEVKALVYEVDDKRGFAYVKIGETKGALALSDMQWARVPNVKIRYDEKTKYVKKPSQILKEGDIVYVHIESEQYPSVKSKRFSIDKSYLYVKLTQKSKIEAALISFDNKNQDIVAMVGGKNFEDSEFNRAIQAKRQTGSSFKVLVYAAALEKGYTPASIITDSPMIYEERDKKGMLKKWRPKNYSGNYKGDVLFRNALKRSLNIPTVKILDDIGTDWVIKYAKRLGVFSPINKDLSLGLGSSSVTLYEMTKVFSQFARLGKRLTPRFINRVENAKGEKIMEAVSLDKRFEKEINELDIYFGRLRKKYGVHASGLTSGGSRVPAAFNKVPALRSSPFFFRDREQLIRDSTAFLTTTMLKAVTSEVGGTAIKASSIGHQVAGKTGTTDDFYDAWFIGYTNHQTTGVWVGYDQEQSLGAGESGGTAALPIWTSFMKSTHKALPKEKFEAPEGVIFVNIDRASGKLASAFEGDTGASPNIISQAFRVGTEPTEANNIREEEAIDYLREELAQ